MRAIINNKKGDLLQNVLSALVAVVGLALIFLAAWKLWSVYANQEERNAQKLIDNIVGKIDNLQEDQDAKIVLRGFGKDNWFLLSWSKNSGGRPDKCYFKSCICICPGRTSDVCQTKGFCRLLDVDGITELGRGISVPQNLFELNMGFRQGGKWLNIGLA